MIVRDPVIAEAAKNDKPDDAQQVTLPATLCGCVEKAEDVDYWKFHAEAGQSLAFHVRAARLEDSIHDLQNHCDPILTLKSPMGAVLASSDNFFFADPVIAHKFEAAGDYLLEIRDVRYEGNQFWEYCIEASSRPVVETTFPLAVNRGQASSLELVGFQLPSPPTGAVTPLADLPLGVHSLALAIGSDLTDPVTLIVTDLPLMSETSEENNTPDKAQAVTVPTGVNGRLETEADVDCYSFEAKKGERWSFEIVARRVQSSVDSYLRILNDKGQQQVVNDDLRQGKRNSSDSLQEFWAPPADGKYIVEVRDVHLRGGPQFPYLLKIERSEPYFELYSDSDKTQLSPGGSGVIFVRCERKNGFTGAVQLAINGLPHGVTASCGKIRADGQDGCIVLQSDHDAPLNVSNVTITGTATHPLPDGTSMTLSAINVPCQEIYFPGGGRGHWQVNTHAVAVTGYGDVRRVDLSDYDITLKAGETKKITITIDRSPGFDKNVTLDMLFQHLGNVFGNSLPKGVTLDDKDVKSLLAGADSSGHLTLKCGADAPPCEAQQCVVMANVSLNFVMKATYASSPVRITVVKP
ncbi:MAG: PPC domain-containing protein [Pirellulaceae bacterium]